MVTPDRTLRVEVAPDVSLEVREWDGGGVPFVLLHGLASNARLWDGVATSLSSAGHRVLAVDQRGHGRSSKPADGYDMVTVTDDLASLISALGLGRPVVVGQSWGANVVIEFGARFPGAARAIGCVDGGTITLRREFPDWESCASVLRPPPLVGTPLTDIERWLRDAHPDWPPEGVAGTLANFEVRDDGTIAPWLDLDRHLLVLRGLWEHDPSERYGDITEPVLFLAADTGPTDDIERESTWREQRRLGFVVAEHLLADVRIEWLVGDHDLHAQHPVQVADLLRTLLDRPPTTELPESA